jgi:protein SCO1/2
MGSAAPANRPGAVTVGDLQIAIPDLLVLDQNGKERRFYSDLIKNKVVVLSFFFTSCVSVCPAMNLALSKLQTNLADRLGKDVFIVTVTKDPETDKPPHLKAWGKALGVKPGWTMVTGEPSVIAKIVRDFTGDRLGKDAHNTIFILGSDRTGNWTDISGYATPEELRQQIDTLTKPVR